MAKSPEKPKVKAQRSAQSTTKRNAKNKAVSAGRKSAEGAPGTCPDCAPRPQGVGPWVFYWDKKINGDWPYWEELKNLGPAPGGGMELKPDVYAERVKGVMPGDAGGGEPGAPPDEPQEPPPPWQTVK